jgi:hypothetical protein
VTDSTRPSFLLRTATGISATLTPRQGNSVCAKWCAASFPNPGKDCTSLAAKGYGPCYECGPACPQPATKILCGGACVVIDDKNCGACGSKVCCLYFLTQGKLADRPGRQCPEGKTCQGGQCKCKPGWTPCGDTCKACDTDNDNCGKCGTKVCDLPFYHAQRQHHLIPQPYSALKARPAKAVNANASLD